MGVQTLKRYTFLATVFTTLLVVILPFMGGGGPSLSSAFASSSSTAILPGTTASLASNVPGSVPVQPATVVSRVVLEAGVAVPLKPRFASTTVDVEHVAQKPVPKPLPPVTATGTGERNQ